MVIVHICRRLDVEQSYVAIQVAQLEGREINAVCVVCRLAQELCAPELNQRRRWRELSARSIHKQ